MKIKGIEIVSGKGCVVCYINDLTDELKKIIKEELSFICWGKSTIEEDDKGFYSLGITLGEFIKRYEKKDKNKRKGLIGEFIAHLVIDKAIGNLKTISRFFNKEERGVKKGFDLVYIDSKTPAVWYGEIKSGELRKFYTPNNKNSNLLKFAKRDLSKRLSGGKLYLWDSAITDVGLSLASGERKRVKDILKDDLKDIVIDKRAKNAILISVLFHDVNNKIETNSVERYFEKIIKENLFAEVILFSIQKSTYQKIERFLYEEAKAAAPSPT